MPGVFNALVGRMAGRLGFQAMYLSGAALSASMGLPDVGLVTLTEFVEEARRLTAACSLPLLCDADVGFGEALNVERTVRLFEGAGAAGIHLEDQLLPKRCGHLSGKKLVEPAAMAAKVRAAAAARKDADFVIVARTDARGVHGFDDAVRRARLYLEAGADVIFPEALESVEEFAAFARRRRVAAAGQHDGVRPRADFGLRGPGGDGLPYGALPGHGPARALRAAEATLAEILAKGHQRDALPRMLSRAELYDLLDYAGYEERDRTYFG